MHLTARRTMLISTGRRLLGTTRLSHANRIHIYGRGRHRWKHEGRNSDNRLTPPPASRTEQLSQRMQRAIQNLSERAVSTTKELSQKAAERVVSSTRNAVKSSKEYIGSQTMEALKSSREYAESTIHVLKKDMQSQAEHFVKQASESSQEMARKTAPKGLSFTQSEAWQVSKSRSGQYAQAVSGRLVAWGQDASRKSASYVQSSVTGATAKVTESIQTKVTGLTGPLLRTVRAALWWALALVGVYGIATTLPVEIFRYLTRSPETQPKEHGNDKPRLVK